MSYLEQPIYNSNPLLNEIPHEFYPYTGLVKDIKGDENCGFQTIVFSLGHNEEYWHHIWSDLYNELITHLGEYTTIHGEYFNAMGHSLNFTGSSFMTSEYWLIMSDTAFLVTNKYGVIVHYLSKEGYIIWFPLWYVS